MAKIKVGVIEDESIVLDSLTSLLGKQHDMLLHSSGRSVDHFMQNSAIEEIDVLLLDIQLPGRSGLEAMRELRSAMPNTDIVMLSTMEESEVIFKALCAGASGYISKRTPLPKIADAVRIVQAGGSYMSPFIARKVVDYFTPKRTQKDSESLTPRQMQIAEALVNGDSYKMIADKYMISMHTVRDHIKAIYRKLHINSKAELMKKSYRGEI